MSMSFNAHCQLRQLNDDNCLGRNMSLSVVVPVKVWETVVELTVHQRSKSVWIAYGEYLGKSYEGQGRTANAAAASWKERARYATN